MKICANISRFGLVAVLLLVAGCAGSGVNSSENQAVRNQKKGDRPPMAVISVAPTQQWLADLRLLLPSSDSLGVLDNDQLANVLPGIDVQQPVTLLLYASKGGTVQPVVYLPVEDYEQFLDGLAKRVRMHRAIASSFMIGSQKILVKQVGEFAVLGTSLKQINATPNSPELFRDRLPVDADFAIKVKTKSLRESEKQKLANLIREYLGDSFAQIAFDTESIAFGLTIDSNAGIQLQTQLSPIPENLDEIQLSLTNAIVKRDLPISSQVSKNKLVFDFNFNANQLDAVWSQFGSVLADSYKVQQRTLIQQVSSSNRAPLPKIFYGNGGSNSSSCEPTGSGGRRSGGG